MSGEPLSYMTQPEYSLYEANPTIDCIDFCTFFDKQDARNLRIVSAIRMNATFPFILPVVKLPSVPMMNVMDAGLRDNFGSEIAARYTYARRTWFENNTTRVIQLDIRDTRENFVGTPFEQNSLMGMIADPIFAIQNKWEAFQSFNHSYIRDLTPSCLAGKMQFVTLRYTPRELEKNAELNFHLTQQEKEDIYRSIFVSDNQAGVARILRTLK